LAEAPSHGGDRAPAARRLARLLARATAVLALASGLSACGASGREAVAARVGHASITTGTLRHWMALIAPAPDQRQRLALERRALDLLIVSQWTIQQAGEEHLGPSAGELERRIASGRASGTSAIPEPDGGDAHRSAADEQLEARAELAAASIRQALAARDRVTRGEVAAFYRQHRRDYRVPQRRYFDIDNLRSEAAALRAKREVEAGASFTTMSLHEELTDVLGSNPGRHAIERAIFAARPHVLGGPVLLADAGDHSLFEVTRIIPAGYRPLAGLEGAIRDRLAGEHGRRALAAFLAAWRAKWVARTSCNAGYDVPACRQFAGPHAVESAFGLG
jgi:hypothetical protein